jgi:hypothetical protein
VVSTVVISAPVIIPTAVTTVVWISKSERHYWRINYDRRWIVCRPIGISRRINRWRINRRWHHWCWHEWRWGRYVNPGQRRQRRQRQSYAQMQSSGLRDRSGS